MVKKLKYLLFFIPFLLTLNVNAAQYDVNAFSAQLYDNRSGTLYSSSTSNTGASYYGVLSLTGYGTGAAWGISSPTIILSGHTYALTANVSLGSSNIALSSINRIGIGTTLDNAKVSYQNNSNVDELYSRVVDTDLVQFAFKANTNASYIVFPFTSTSSVQTDIFLSYILFEDLGTGGVSQTEINSSLNSQTNTINQSITNSQNSINNNSNNNRDLIIDNQNENTQAIIDSNKENFQTCRQSYNLLNLSGLQSNTLQGITMTPHFENGILTHILFNGTSTKTVFFKINTSNFVSTKETIISGSRDTVQIYASTANGTRYFSDIPANTTITDIIYRIPANTTVNLWVYPMIREKGKPSTFEPYGKEFCTNKLDDQTNAINGLNDSITSQDNPNTNQDINDMNDMVASDTPISDLITMPLTLINAYINGIGASCSPVNLGSLLGTNLTIPCINIQQHIGTDLWNTIDILCCIFLCYEIAMLFISAFDGITSLRDDFEGLYQPKHAYTGYVAKHGGGN